MNVYVQSYKDRKEKSANMCIRNQPTMASLQATISEPPQCPRAEMDVAEPPVFVIRETQRRRLCKKPLQKATLECLAGNRTFYKPDRVLSLASNRVAGEPVGSWSMATPLLHCHFCDRTRTTHGLGFGRDTVLHIAEGAGR